MRHGLKKDALHSKLFSLCAAAPDDATVAFLHAMTLALPAAVEQQLMRYADALQPGELALAPQLLGVLSRLPDNADQAETLRLLLHLASRVSPDKPADLSVVFTELRRSRALRDDHAYSAALAQRSTRAERQEVAPAFATAAATLLRNFLAALSPSDHGASEEAWSLPSDLMWRAYDGAEPSEVALELRRAVLRVPPAQEELLWAALRPLGSFGHSSMAAVLRAWWAHHDPSDVGAMERAARELQAKGGYAAALDLVRWAEGTGRRVSQVKIGDWDALHHRVLRGCAEERCKAAVRVNNIDIEICADSAALTEPSSKTDRGAAAARVVAWEEGGSRSLRLDKVNGHASLGFMRIVVWEMLYAHGHARPEAPEDLVLHDEAARAPEHWRTVLDLVGTGDPSRPRLRVQLTWAVGASCRREQRLPMRAHPTNVDLPERQRAAAEDERRAAGLQSAHADVHLTTEGLQHCETRGWVGFVSMADPGGVSSGAILSVADLTEAEATLLHARENMASDVLAHGDHVLTVASGHGLAHGGLASVPRGYHAAREAIKVAAVREAAAHPPAHSLSVAELAIVEAAAAGSDTDAPARARHRAAAAAARSCAEGSSPPTGVTASTSAGTADAESTGRRERKRQQLGRGMPSAGALGKLLPPDVIKSLASLAKDTAQLAPRRPGSSPQLVSPAMPRPLDFIAGGAPSRTVPATIAPIADRANMVRITADGASTPAARLQALAAAGLALSRPRAARDDTDSDATLGPLSGGSSDEGAPFTEARSDQLQVRPAVVEPWAEDAAAGKNVPTAATPGSSLPDEEHTLRLKVASSWGSDLFFKMTDDMPMGRLIKACCERMCVDPRGALFTVPLKKAKDPNEPKEGAHAAESTEATEATEAKSPEARVQDPDAERVRVGRTDTPASLGLHDGDLIELEVDPEYKDAPLSQYKDDVQRCAELERAQAAAKANEIAMQLMAEEEEAKEKEGRKARKAKAKQEEAAKAAQGKKAAAKLQREAEEEQKRQKAAARQAELVARKQAVAREEAERIARGKELAARDQAARQEAAKEEAAAARARREASEEAQAKREARRLAQAAEAEARAAAAATAAAASAASATAAASAASASAASYRGLSAGGSGLSPTFRSLSPVDLQNEPSWQSEARAPSGLPTPVGGGTSRTQSRTASGDGWPNGAAGAHPLWEGANISHLWAEGEGGFGPREGLPHVWEGRPHVPSGALDFATPDARAVGGSSAPAAGSAALGGAVGSRLGGRDAGAGAPGGPGGSAGLQQPSGVGCGLQYTHEQLVAATQGFAEASACNRRGTVHRGVLAASATPVAVKRVPPSGRGPRSETTRRAEERARSEAALLARAAHPNVVALLGFSDDGPAPSLVLGLMAGGSLQRRLGATGGGLEPLPPAARLCVLSDVARALAHLHAACGLAHRGLTAASVLLSHPPPGGLPEARLGGFEDAAEHGTLEEHSPGALGDCLAYGLLVLEVLTALPATALSAAPSEETALAHAGLAGAAAQMHHSLPELVRRLDSRAGGGSMGVWDEAVEAGVVHALHAAVQRCLEPRLELRATMRALLPEMERLRAAAERMGAGRRARRGAAAAPGAPLPWSSSWPSAQPPALQSLGECVVCLEHLASHILVPCGHCCCCESCGEALLRSSRLCPVCQGESREAVRVFLV